MDVREAVPEVALEDAVPSEEVLDGELPDEAADFKSRATLDAVAPIHDVDTLPLWVRESIKAPPAGPSETAAYARFIQRMYMDALRLRMEAAQDARIAEAMQVARQTSADAMEREERACAIED